VLHVCIVFTINFHVHVYCLTILCIKMFIFAEKSTKTRSGAKSGDQRKVLPKAFEVADDQNCPVKIYKAYRDHRPEGRLTPDARFYLRPLDNPKTDIWYSKQCLGKNKLGCIMKNMAEKVQLESRKVNHSSRKTFATTLLHGGTPITEVAALRGWKRIESIKHYATPTVKEQEKASETLSSIMVPLSSESKTDTNVVPHNQSLSTPVSTIVSTEANDMTLSTPVSTVVSSATNVINDMNISNNSNMSTVNKLCLPMFDMTKINGILYGANINCGTINFNFNAKN